MQLVEILEALLSSLYIISDTSAPPH